MENKYKLGGGYAWLVWLIATIFVVWLFNVQTGYAILNHDVAKSLHLSIEQVGLIAATYTWVFAIVQLFSGALLDKLGAKRVLVPAIFFVMVGVFIFANATNFEMLLLSQFILAIGSSAGFVGAGYVGGVWFGMAKFGIMFGLVQMVASLSSAFGQTAFDFALSHMSWQTLMFGFGIFGIILLIVAAIFIKNPTPMETKFTPGQFIISVVSAIIELLKKGQIWAISIQGAIIFGMILALGVVWGPKLLIAHGLSMTEANHATACIWLGLAVGAAFINKISNSMKSRKHPIIIATLIQILALAAAVYLDLSPILAMVVYFVFGVCNAGHMLNFTAAGDIVPVHLIGTSASIVNGSMFVAGGILMGLPGKMLAGTQESLADYQSAMIVMVGALILALLVAVFWMKESYKE
ncbi:MFS transporter [Dialister micraerophilus]|uniref:MFS transporter n=1 Tax=Dialister micraerophilus TaxID=309120 RepID=UPI0023F51482|nr:MFS transporter [Dialister micraerophilus]